MNGTAFKLGTFAKAVGAPFAAIVLGEQCIEITEAAKRAKGRPVSGTTIDALLDDWDANFAALQEIVAILEKDGMAGAAKLSDLRPLSPVTRPGKMFYAAQNFQEHVDEMIRAGDRKATLARRAIQSLDRYISATQLGITLSSLGLGWIGEPALAQVIGNALGFRTVIVIPETQSQEKKDALRLLGARLVEVPALPFKNPNNYVHYSERLARALAETEPNGAVWANQWDNTANRRAHIETTAEEIWADTDGKVDGFVSAVGSGGTLGGTSDGLKAKRKDIQIALADVPGASLYSYFTTGEFKAEGSSITEGIGTGRITKNMEGAVVDRAYMIPDAESVSICFQLLQEEGLCVGGSSGVNVAGAIRLAKELGPGKTIVTMLCDYGTRYQTKLFDPAFLRSKNLPVPDWLATAAPPPPRVFVDADKA